MSQLLSEDVIAVPPLSLRDVERKAGEVRALLVSLTRPEGAALPWDALVDRHLPRAGLLFYPASGAELRDCEAATDPSGETAIHILMRAELYEALTDPGPGGNRARATVAHELGRGADLLPALTEYVEFYPGHTGLVLALCELLIAQGKADEARERLETLLLFEPDNAEAQALLARIAG